mmetsp:Transcript_5785/g.17844  ORF Transcript_5785/g.17844 Transcript_5785/m.17844 type:complete len:194 (+) Transcript_5785:914-1495(+)
MVDKPELILFEIDGLAPAGTSAIYRLELPSPGAPFSSPLLMLDTTAPLVDGKPTQWLVDEESATVRGVIMHDGGTTKLMMREMEESRHGGERWSATCKRLGLPLPPVDPSAPPTYSEWRKVAEWDEASQVSRLHIHPLPLFLRALSLFPPPTDLNPSSPPRQPSLAFGRALLGCSLLQHASLWPWRQMGSAFN